MIKLLATPKIRWQLITVILVLFVLYVGVVAADIGSTRPADIRFNEHWFGIAASPSGETHRADHMVVESFVITAGNDTWGPAIQIMGSLDTPHVDGSREFHLDTVLIEDVSAPASLDLHLIQIGFGETFTAALTADTLTEINAHPEQNAKAGPIKFGAAWIPAGTKVWVRHWVEGTNAPNMHLHFAIHER